MTREGRPVPEKGLARGMEVGPASAGLRRFWKPLVSLGVAGVLLASLSVSAGAQTDGTSAEGLESAVLKEMGQDTTAYAKTFASKKSAGETQVNVMKESKNGDWAMGSAVIEAPKKKGYYPEGWLFVASAGNDGWKVELEGSRAFSTLAEEAPQSVVSEDEAKIFATQSKTVSSKAAKKVKNTNLMLPWKKGTNWKLTGGPHGWSDAYSKPYSSLDLAGRGGDQRVRAAGGGRVYNMCSSGKGWIRVYHPSGYSTNYYHLAQNIRPKAGTSIKGGTVLGLTGQETSCGGAAYGRHVHFSLLRGDTFVGINNKRIGGWVFRQGEAYRGYAQRGGVNKSPVSVLKNYGGVG